MDNITLFIILLCLGIRKRDELQAPLRLNDSRFMFLLKAADLFQSWKESKNTGLTAETSLAWYLTLRTICAVVNDLLKNHGFEYVMTGKLQSDPIEGRFGNWRQMSGANFFMSVKQLMSSEKKIRVHNKLTDLLKIVSETDGGETLLCSLHFLLTPLVVICMHIFRRSQR